MGFFSSLFRRKNLRKNKIEIQTEIEAQISHRTISDHDQQLKYDGYKEDAYGNLYPPDTVFINKGSNVYHAASSCRGVAIYGGIDPMSESEAISLGYRRCGVCDWKSFGKPLFHSEMPLVLPAPHTSSHKSKEALSYVKQGYPVFQGYVYPLDTVFVLGNSKTYHSSADSKSCSINQSRTLPIPESEAVRRGFRRCKRCHWKTPVPPTASPYPVEIAKPICSIYVE